MKELIHGGDIYRQKVEWDFSVNINPLGMPEGVEQSLIDAINESCHYPDIKSEQLCNEISKKECIDARDIICGNGASELFLSIVHACKPKKIVIPVPSFYGYEYVAEVTMAEVDYVQVYENAQEIICEHLKEDTDLLFLANPNNPTGQLLSQEAISSILKRAREYGITVVLDECFIEFVEEYETYSMIHDYRKYPNLILVRAFTKIYAIPGIRLAYLCCANTELLKQIHHQLPEWNVSVLAQIAGVAALQEQVYVKKTIEYVKKEREYLVSQLKRWMIVYPSAANFLLVKTEKPLYQRLLLKGILIRDCSNFRGLGEGYYRIAIRTKEENELFIRTLKAWYE